MRDLHDLLVEAADRNRPDRIPPFPALRAKARHRRRLRFASRAAAATAVAAAAAVAVVVVQPSAAPISQRPLQVGGTAAPLSSPATEAAATAAACHSTDLAVTATPAQSAAGHSGLELHFTDTSGRPCTLEGYPGVAGLDGAGTQVTQAVRTPAGFLGGLGGGAHTPPVVILSPGQEGTAVVEGTDVPSGTTACPTLVGLLVTAPNTYHSLPIALAPGDCSGLQVHPVVPGTTGSWQPSNSTTPSAAPTAISPPAAAACRSTQLRVVAVRSTAASAHAALVLRFRNISTSSCQLYGYPGVAGLDAAGTQVTQARWTPRGPAGGLRRGQRTGPVLTLAPGQSAAAVVESVSRSGHGSSCRRLAGLLVTAPNTRHSVTVPVAPRDCDGLQAHPVLAGTTGRAR